MEIIIGKLSGFCPGVKRAVSTAEEELKNGEKIYCLGEIVHNNEVIKKLERLGMITVENIEEVPDNSKVIFRAHGEALEIYEKAENKNLEIIDLTCNKVKNIHELVKKESDDSFVIIFGKKNHPESIGTKGFTKKSYILEKENELDTLYKEIEKSNCQKIYIVSQTTSSSKKFDEVSKKIKEQIKDKEVKISKTICFTTEKRQEEVANLAKQVKKMIIIGGKHSSNTKELANVSLKYCNETYLVENVEEINKEDFKHEEKIGIMAGASTPEESIIEIKKFLENI